MSVLRARGADRPAEAAMKGAGTLVLRALGADGAVAETAWDVEHVEGPLWLLRRDGRTHAAHVARAGRATWVHVDGRTHLVERVDAAAGGAGGGTDAARRAEAGTLLAPMTGRVLEVLVEEGAAVEAGRPLLVLSAMKMQLEMKAPVAGKVRRVACRAGQQVDGGDVLVVVEPDGSP